MTTFLQFVDVFDKSRDDVLRVRTKTGSLISLSFVILSFIIIGTDIINFIQPHIYRDLNVDPSLTNNKDLVNISINVIVDLPCFFLHLDSLDSLGFDKYYVSDTIKFKRLSVIDESEALPSTISSYKFLGIANKSAKDVCFPCYDISEFLRGQGESCCNSCEQLILLYRRFGKTPEPQNWEQCKAGKYSRDVSFDEKCQVKGKITVNKVSGSFHIAPGINSKFLMKYHRGGHSHDLNFDFPEQGLGMDHQIIKIRFGSKNIPKSSNTLSNILNGQLNSKSEQKTASQNNGKSIALRKKNANRHKPPMIYRYDLTSTPAIYVKRKRSGDFVKAVGFDTSVATFKYPRTCTCQNPGIFFFYSFTPYTVVISDEDKDSGFVQIISSTLGFLTGCFVIASVVDAVFAKVGGNGNSNQEQIAEEQKDR